MVLLRHSTLHLFLHTVQHFPSVSPCLSWRSLALPFRFPHFFPTPVSRGPWQSAGRVELAAAVSRLRILVTSSLREWLEILPMLAARLVFYLFFLAGAPLARLCKLSNALPFISLVFFFFNIPIHLVYFSCNSRVFEEVKLQPQPVFEGLHFACAL